MTASVSESVGGEVPAYDGQNGYSEYSASGGRRRGKKNSRRRRSRKMYGGNDQSAGLGTLQEQEQEQAPKVSQNNGDSTGPGGGQGTVPDQMSGQDGGRRRRGKTHKGKMYKGKFRKGKTRKGKVSKWIIHVKNFSRTNKMDFRDALKDRNCKASYHRMK